MPEVNPFRGFIRPVLRQTGVTLYDHEPQFLLETNCSESLKGWADEASSGTHPWCPIIKTHPSPIGEQDYRSIKWQHIKPLKPLPEFPFKYKVGFKGDGTIGRGSLK